MFDWSTLSSNISKALPFLGTAGSILGGFASSRGGGTSVYKTNRIATHQMNLNKQYTQWLNENGYSQLRKGLEEANYNPMLALGSTPQQGTMGAPQATEGTTARSFDLNNIVGLKNTQASTAKLEADANSTNLGVIGRLLGNLGQINSNAKRYGFYDSFIKIRNGALNSAKSIINKINRESKNSYVLKGYISNSSRSYHDFESYYPTVAERNAVGRASRYNSPVPSSSLAF